MTSIAIWLNSESSTEKVWAVGDSRISGTNDKVISDSCPKIFSIPIQVNVDNEQYFQMKISALGFCFSGSTIIGHTCYLKLSEALSKLTMTSHSGNFYEPKKLPAVSELAKLLKTFANNSLKELCDYHFMTCNKSIPQSELAIWSYCNQSEQFKLFSLKLTPNPQSEFQIEEVDLRSTKYYLLGSRQDYVQSKINGIYAEAEENSLRFYRAPCHGIQEVIIEEQSQQIGGQLQIAITDKFNTHIYFPSNHNNIWEGVHKLNGYISTPKKLNFEF